MVVFVPAQNEAASIRETISSLRRETRPPDEIIVVGDNSSDATDDRSMLHGAKVEPWGQTVARLLSPESAIVGLSYAPSLHASNAS